MDIQQTNVKYFINNKMRIDSITDEGFDEFISSLWSNKYIMYIFTFDHFWYAVQW